MNHRGASSRKRGRDGWDHQPPIGKWREIDKDRAVGTLRGPSGSAAERRRRAAGQTP